MPQTPLPVSPPLLGLFRASRNWSLTPEAELQWDLEPQSSVCPTDSYKAPTAGQALADGSWPGFPRTNLCAEPSLMNAPPDPAELASSCLSTQPFPLLPLPGSLPYCPFGRKECFSC